VDSFLIVGQDPTAGRPQDLWIGGLEADDDFLAATVTQRL
jgi:hypothetical protein